MRVLIIGGGGREHALAWKVAQSQSVQRVYVAPGNAGTAAEPRVENVAIDTDDLDALSGFARDNRIDLTIVGPEAPLVAGICDRFESAGLAIFGPSAAAARLEGSKTFTKDFLARHRIPTAAYGAFTEIEPALDYLRQQGVPIVIKADGLAAGKGVVLADSLEQAESAIRDMLSGDAFGEAGRRVVIEEFLRGEEASFICMVDGTDVLPMATSQDHKARDAGDRGPNTGGMGAYSPAPVVDAHINQRILDEVIYPTVRGMAAEGNRYRGFLYAGLMIDADGTPKVLEYNVRFGDPETQPIMMRLQSDLALLCQAAVEGRLASMQAHWAEQCSLGVVMAAGGYPEQYAKGKPISGLEAAEATGCKVFHAGTRADEQGRVLTAGGRVLCVCALGDNVSEAKDRAYAGVDEIQWDSVYFRPDIGYRAVARERQG